MRLHSLLLAGLVGVAALCVDASAPFDGPASAQARVSIAYSLDRLVEISPQVVIAKAVERRSEWAQVAGSRRIVTYTKLDVQETVYGKSAKSVWVRTLGGAVGRIGQQVAGEALFRMNQSSIVFLHNAKDGATVVAGAAQGHFPVVKPKKKGEAPTVKMSASLGTVLPRRGPTVSVQERLVGLKLEEATAKIRASKTRLDALRKKQRQ